MKAFLIVRNEKKRLSIALGTCQGKPPTITTIKRQAARKPDPDQYLYLIERDK